MGMARLVGDCKERYPHPIWDRIGALDYQGAAKDLREWLLQQAVPDAVEVIWFAMWDVNDRLRLGGSTSWSRDPEDWEWWFHDDFDAGSYAPVVLDQMHDLARQAEDPTRGPRPRAAYWSSPRSASRSASSAWPPCTRCAASVHPQTSGASTSLGRQRSPDEVYGIVLGRLADNGFTPFGRP